MAFWLNLRRGNGARRSNIFTAGIFLALFGTALLQAESVTATVDAQSTTINDVISFSITAEGVSENPQAEITELLDDFTVVSGPAQLSNIQYVNGRMTSSRSLTWSLVPNHTGILQIPALQVQVGSKTYQTNPISIKVTDSQEVQPSDDLFLVSEIDKVSAVPGEQITVTYKLYTKVNLSITNVTFPKFEGFWTEELFAPRQVDFRDTHYKGVKYQVATLYKVAIFPTKVGELELAPMALSCNVEIRKNRGRRSIWDDPFFGGMTVTSQPKLLRTEDPPIRVTNYSGKIPSHFTNAVGEFRISANLDQSEIKTNEAVTYRITLTGTGNLPILTMPEIQFPKDLEVFPPTVTLKREPFRDEISGTITQEYIIIPRKPGTYMLPRVVLPYYNPARQDWDLSEIPAKKLTVAKGAEVITADQGFTKDEIVLLGQDIRFMSSETPAWLHRGENAFNWSVLGLYLTTAGLFILPGIGRNISDKRTGTEKLRVSRNALKKAVKELGRKENDVFEQAARTSYVFLKERFVLTTDNLDPLWVKENLSDRIQPETLNSLVSILKLCDAGRYAQGAAEKKDVLLMEVAQILKKIDING